MAGTDDFFITGGDMARRKKRLDLSAILTGGASGAAIGGRFGGPWGAALGGLAGGLGGAFLGGDDQPEDDGVDLSGELNRLEGLFNTQRAQAKSEALALQGELEKRAVSSLAGRGILTSPVSEYTLGRTREAALRAQGRSLADIAAQEAGARISLINALLGRSAQSGQLAGERRRRSRDILFSALAAAGTQAAFGPRSTTAGGGWMVAPSGGTSGGSGFDSSSWLKQYRGGE